MLSSHWWVRHVICHTKRCMYCCVGKCPVRGLWLLLLLLLLLLCCCCFWFHFHQFHPQILFPNKIHHTPWIKLAHTQLIPGRLLVVLSMPPRVLVTKSQALGEVIHLRRQRRVVAAQPHHALLRTTAALQLTHFVLQVPCAAQWWSWGRVLRTGWRLPSIFLPLKKDKLEICWEQVGEVGESKMWLSEWVNFDGKHW